MTKRFFIGVSFAAAMLLGLAAYYLYAPNPQVPLAAVEEITLNFDNRARRYSVYYPPNLKPGARLLFALHPSMSSGGEMRSWVGPTLERFATKQNTVVVYPDGYEGHFNDCRKLASYSARALDIDDVGFIRHITERLVTEKQISTEHIYAMGYSNGGHLAFRLAMEAPGLLKGMVAIAANLPAADSMACRVMGSLPPFVRLVEGTADPINPYDGGQVTLFGFGNRGNVLSADASAQWFANAAGISDASAQPDIKILGSRVQIVQQKDWLSSAANVSLITLVGGGHTVPQANYRFRRILGATLEDDFILESALAAMFSFVSEHAADISAKE
jgi:polyhydroxybutyrate depolymerase